MPRTIDQIDADLTVARLDWKGLSTQVGTINTAIKVVGLFALSGLISSIWWGASITTRLDLTAKRFEERFQEVDKKLDKLDLKFDKVDDRFKEVNARLDRMEKESNARLDRVESAITKLIEQTKPAPKL